MLQTHERSEAAIPHSSWSSMLFHTENTIVHGGKTGETGENERKAVSDPSLFPVPGKAHNISLPHYIKVSV